MELVSVVVCTGGARPAELARCVRSLAELHDDAHEILVVDNTASGDVDAAGLGSLGARVVHEPRRGLDVARNRGVAESAGDVVAFIDDDCEADPAWLSGIRRGFEQGPGLVTGRVLAARMMTEAEWWFEHLMTFDRGPAPRLVEPRPGRGFLPDETAALGTGCNMAYRRDVLERVGPFDVALDMGTPVGGGGDLDMFRRVLDAGFAAAYRPDAVVFHFHRATHRSLRRQLFGYGATVGALSTKFVLTYPGRKRRVLRYQYRWLLWMRALALARSRGDASFPVGLLAAHVAGNFWGPLAYLRSRSRSRSAA